MAVLWCGGEDVDFPNGSPVTMVSSSYVRTGYARYAAWSAGAISPNFLNPVTSLWLTCRTCSSVISDSVKFVGVCKDQTSLAGIYFGTSLTSAYKLALLASDGTTTTTIAVESGSSYTATSNNSPHRLDMQIVDYGSASTINLYLNGNLIITFTGDSRITGVSNFRAVSLHGASSYAYMSEIIIADEDTRAFPGLVTLAPNGAGTSTFTSGAHTDIDEATIDDNDMLTSAANSQAFTCALTDSPTTLASVAAVKVAARAAKGTDSGPGTLKLGVSSGGTVNTVDKALTTSPATYERLMLTNPVTSAAFTVAEVNALLLALGSGA